MSERASVHCNLNNSGFVDDLCRLIDVRTMVDARMTVEKTGEQPTNQPPPPHSFSSTRPCMRSVKQPLHVGVQVGSNEAVTSTNLVSASVVTNVVSRF